MEGLLEVRAHLVDAKMVLCVTLLVNG